MRRGRVVCWMLSFLAIATATPALATSVTVQISGTWDSVIDNASVLDGSITVGGSFTATLVFDDGAPDTNGLANVGDYLLPAATTDLVLSTGSYSFSLLSTSSVSFGIEDNVGGQDGFGFFAEHFTTTGPLAAGASTGYAYSNPALFDNSQSAHSSDDLTALPWDISAYDNASFYYLAEVLGKGSNKFIELQGTITDLTLLPEPSALMLLGLGLGALVVARIRG
jgi:hypothetical protein